MTKTLPRVSTGFLLSVLVVVFFLAGGAALWKQGMQQYMQLKGKMNALLVDDSAQQEVERQLRQFEADVAATLERLAQYGTAPAEALVSAFIRHIETLAREEGVTIQGIVPGAPIATDPMIKTPFQMEISGDFPRLHRFLARTENSLLPIQVETIQMTKGDGKALEVTLACYILSTQENRDTTGKGAAAEAIFTSEPLGEANPMFHLKRNIFFYRPEKTPDISAKKKQAGKPTRKQARRDRFARSQLNAVFYDGPDSMVLLDGVTLSIGDIYKGYRVKAIGENRVILVDRRGKYEIVIKNAELVDVGVPEKE